MSSWQQLETSAKYEKIQLEKSSGKITSY